MRISGLVSYPNLLKNSMLGFHFSVYLTILQKLLDKLKHSGLEGISNKLWRIPTFATEETMHLPDIPIICIGVHSYSTHIYMNGGHD